MDNGFIDLGQKMDMGATKPSEVPKVSYPTMYISHKMDKESSGLDGLPDGEFEFTGKGRVVSYKENKKDGTCQCEIEVMAIKPSTSKSKKKSKSSEESLDEAFSKISDEKESVDNKAEDDTEGE